MLVVLLQGVWQATFGRDWTRGTTDRWKQAGEGWTGSRRLETCRMRCRRVNSRADDGFKTWIIPEQCHVACEGPLTRMRPLQGRRVGFCWTGPDGKGEATVALACAMFRSCRKLQCDAIHSPMMAAMMGTCLSAWLTWSSASCSSRLRDRIDFDDFGFSQHNNHDNNHHNHCYFNPLGAST
jgi:hypothetical protein